MIEAFWVSSDCKCDLLNSTTKLQMQTNLIWRDLWFEVFVHDGVMWYLPGSHVSVRAPYLPPRMQVHSQPSTSPAHQHTAACISIAGDNNCGRWANFVTDTLGTTEIFIYIKLKLCKIKIMSRERLLNRCKQIHTCTIIYTYNVWHKMLVRMLKHRNSAFSVGGHGLNPISAVC